MVLNERVERSREGINTAVAVVSTPLDVETTGRGCFVVVLSDTLGVRNNIVAWLAVVIAVGQWPGQAVFVNGLLRKKGLQQLVQYGYLHFGVEKTVGMLDAIKDLGFLYATCAGISIGVEDLIVPEGKPKLVKPGEIVEVDIDLWSTAYTFMAGHRPALHISSSNFPRFDRNLNSAKAPYDWTTPAKAENTVYHDAEHPSYLEVPTLK